MKRIATAFALVGMFVFQACEGPEGPQGPPGIDAEYIVGSTYEIQGTFTVENTYEIGGEFIPPIEESNVVLIYRLAGVDDTGRDQWAILPETYYLAQGILTYIFEFTTDNFVIFLDGDIDFNTLDRSRTDNQVFRIVVVPSDFPTGRIDYSDYEGVTKLLGIEDGDFIRLDSKK